MNVNRCHSFEDTQEAFEIAKDRGIHLGAHLIIGLPGENMQDILQHAKAISTHDARSRILSNADGTVVQDGREVLKRLVTQVSNPVRWDLCMETLRAQGVTGVIELAPGGTLAGLIKRAAPEIEQCALKSPADIPAAREFAARHGKA